MSKNDLRYNNDGFFNLEGWFKLLNINYEKDKSVVIITSPRNNGKSSNAWLFIENEIWKKHDYKYKVAIVRTNDLRMKEAIASFKASFGDRYIVLNGFIYKTEKDEKGKFDLNKKEEIGRFVNVENEHNYRSGADGGFKGYNFVFWDEFNETKQQSMDLFVKFSMLFSTIERYNSPFTFLLMGNKINANNDIFTRFNLNVSRRNLNNDYIQKVSDRVVYVDVGFDTYKHLSKDNNSLVNEVASFDKKANSLFNKGGFLEGTKYNVLNYLNFTNKEVLYYFTIDNDIVEYGIFKNSDVSNEPCFFINEISEPLTDRPIVALNVEGYANQGMTIDNDDLSEVADAIFEKIQNKNLYYSSFYIMDKIENWVFRKTKLFGN